MSKKRQCEDGTRQKVVTKWGLFLCDLCRGICNFFFKTMTLFECIDNRTLNWNNAYTEKERNNLVLILCVFSSLLCLL